MIKTKIKKSIAVFAIAALAATSFGSALAAPIGTGSVNGTTTFDSVINWDDNFPGFASGSVSGIIVTAQVLPTLNMTVSTGTIDLGTLVSGVESTGNLDIEVGTNAINGVSITARSGSGGLTNTTDNSIQINNSNADGSAENYSFASTAGAIDSTISGFATSGNLAQTEVNDSITEYPIYTTNSPELTDGANADVQFTVASTTNAQTAAGDYQDNITFTVTGNF